MNKLNAFSIFNKAEMNEGIEPNTEPRTPSPMQEASNYGFQTARMTMTTTATTTRRRWPLSLIYVYPAGPHPSARAFAINNYGDRLLFAPTVCIIQLRFLLFARLSLRSMPKSMLVLCTDSSAGLELLPLSFCILKAISSEFFGCAVCFCFSFPSFCLPPFSATDFQ